MHPISKTISIPWLNNYKVEVDIIQKKRNLLQISDDPCLSIVISNYNRQNNLINLLKSIERQNFTKNFEVIIIDDNSSDNSINVLKSYKNINIIKLKKNSGSETLPQNIGLYFAKTEFVFYVDSDDYLLDTNSLQTMYSKLKSNKNIMLAISNIIFQYETDEYNEKFYGTQKYDNKLENLFFYREKIIKLEKRRAQEYSLFDLMVYAYHIGFRCFRKKDLIEIGGWPLELQSYDDFGVILNLAIVKDRNPNKIILPVNIDSYVYRITGNQASLNNIHDSNVVKKFLIKKIKSLGLTYKQINEISIDQESKGRVSIREQWKFIEADFK